MRWGRQVAVVRNHHGSIHHLGENIDEQVRGDIDIRALLFPAGDGCHEPCVRNVLLISVLHHHGPLGPADDGLTIPAGGSEGRRGDPSHVVAVADSSGRTGAVQCSEVNILFALAVGVAGSAHSRRAIGDRHDGRIVPARPRGDQAGCKSFQVEPTPPGSRSTAQSSAAVVQVVPVDVDTHVHEIKYQRSAMMRPLRRSVPESSR